MSYPNELKYTKEHEWIKIEGNNATIGITKFAIEQLGDIVFLDLPKVGSSFKAGGNFGTIESVKTVSDLFMPVTCKVTEVNQSAIDSPESLSVDAYAKGWLIKVEIENVPADLLSAHEYENYVVGGN
ncbi:glycine cleavage system protein GcvH [Fluviispira multicolorata]|uniref:Glycine cleavage system H protein n=1 Tax=Fluviispira multicolorata TaxID=2654512 RepID=A0A833N444_9BACT|nr:glycine cleavage system protein GcvH [Fluviispira multicolorata]KAB8031024.1 glycine cleavage system protein GcvH [Fluviispira multicolorata]